MEKNLIFEELKKAIKANQKLNGIEDVIISQDTRPIGGLRKFDSLTSLEVLISLEKVFEDKYDIECELDTDTFYNKKGNDNISQDKTNRPLTVEEIVENIYRKLK